MPAIDPERSVRGLIMTNESQDSLNTAFTFDDQNPGFSARMCNMFTSNPREKYVSNYQCYDALSA